MDTQAPGTYPNSGPVDIRTALTIRSWCDQKFAAEFQDNPIAATKMLLREHGMDEALAHDYVGELPRSPVTMPEAPVPMKASSTYDPDECPDLTIPEMYCYLTEIQCQTQFGDIRYSCEGCPAETEILCSQ